ncbi:hypothetical protein CAPTEDRAFT_185326 [Capitella teleta]|uniref:EF-hand domain-containing protein n=1 Tax=Capitella teleta TaxID=283909 RepID=R7T413_CAPTE|nr:hypothetical protein CAPTEDRAFT_185326 [Capitella teleta]|eukprot:ELT87548.1 hypothetical protein CAPTEDRAFT_185326 [Capitella teleta]
MVAPPYPVRIDRPPAHALRSTPHFTSRSIVTEVVRMAEGRDMYMEFFRQADTDGNEFLDIDELVAMMRRKGYKGSDAEIKDMFRRMDTSGDNRVSLDEYLYAMGALPPQAHNWLQSY